MTVPPGAAAASPAEVAAMRLRRVHFVAIGGIGMSGIARIMLARGYGVSGSDAADSAVLQDLRNRGALVNVGHQASNVGDVDTVVVSTAVRPSNPEVAAAKQRGIRVIPRAAALAAIMLGRRGVAVAGTAGKTTTTSMLVVALRAAGLDPSYSIGGELASTGVNAAEGTGEIFVAEADESDGSFLLLRPELAVVTNVEADHLDQHGTPSAYAAAFDAFLRCIEPGGVLVAGLDDPGSRRLAGEARSLQLRVRTFGRAADADLRLTELRLSPAATSYTATLGDRRIDVTVQGAGLHLALDSAAALLAGLELGADETALVCGLADFSGVRRRFEVKGSARGVRVFDDYAHHPTKVTAALDAARIVAGAGRLVVVFQPHLYSRTRDFADGFGIALGLADEVVVMDVYGHREDPIAGITGAMVAERIPLDPARVHFEPDPDAVAPLVAGLARDGDVIVTIGAGDVTTQGDRILAALSVDDTSRGANR